LVDVSGDGREVQALSQQDSQIDANHDAYALTVLAPGAANGNELLSLRDMLFPEKRQHMKKSYRGEVGHAVLWPGRWMGPRRRDSWRCS
jgi:hypothetical protein